jgi:hypothetical protein
LPSTAIIEQEVSRQARGKARGQLAETNLEIKGKGTKVTLANDLTLAKLDQQAQANDENPNRRAEREEKEKRERQDGEGEGSRRRRSRPGKGQRQRRQARQTHQAAADSPPTGQARGADDRYRPHDHRRESGHWPQQWRDDDDASDNRGSRRHKIGSRISKSHLNTKAGDLKFASAERRVWVFS